MSPSWRACRDSGELQSPYLDRGRFSTRRTPRTRGLRRLFLAEPKATPFPACQIIVTLLRALRALSGLRVEKNLDATADLRIWAGNRQLGVPLVHNAQASLSVHRLADVMQRIPAGTRCIPHREGAGPAVQLIEPTVTCIVPRDTIVRDPGGIRIGQRTPLIHLDLPGRAARRVAAHEPQIRRKARLPAPRHPSQNHQKQRVSRHHAAYIPLPPPATGYVSCHPPPRARYSDTRLSETLVVLVASCCWVDSRLVSAVSTSRKFDTPSV